MKTTINTGKNDVIAPLGYMGQVCNRVTRETVRIKLPGFKRVETLVSDATRKIEWETEIRGCFNELVTLSYFTVTNRETGEARVFKSLDEALDYWEKI